MALGTFVDLKVGTTITQVDNYSSLPLPTSVPARYYWVSNSQGVKWVGVLWGGNYYPRGLYYSNGTSWEYIENPIQATLTETDAGVIQDKFVSPYTLEEFYKWTTKYDASNPAGYQTQTEVQALIDASVLEDITTEVPTGLINGVNAIFTLANTPIPDTEEVFLNGLKLLKPQDYNILGATITLISSPGIDETITVNYKI